MIPTPDYKANFEKLYEPAEDTYLILDALEQEIPWFCEHKFNNRVPLCVEIGTGTGVITTFVQKHVLKNNALYLTSDLNKYACEVSIDTSKRNNNGVSKIDSVQCDLISCIVDHSVDLLIFNPPYVPSGEVPSIDLRTFDTDNDVLLDLALCGGADGMEVTRRLLSKLDRILSLNGVALILFCARNKPKVVVENFLNSRGDKFSVDNVIHRKAGWEELDVYRFIKLKH